MKFLDQVNIYQKALTRKSRFYSFLMLISGISLVAAAPFLSYEVSKIECHEKGNGPTSIGENQMIIMKKDWEQKDQEIANLEQTNKIKEDEIQNLIENSDCEEVTRVITNERDLIKEKWEQLIIEVKTIEIERDSCCNRLVDCEDQNRTIKNEEKDCSEIEKEKEIIIEQREVWKTRYEECKEEIRVLIADTKDCGPIEEELNRWRDKFNQCQEQFDKLKNQKPDCSAFETRIKDLLESLKDLEQKYADCQKRLERKNDCSKIEIELAECNEQLSAEKETNKDLSRRLAACEKKVGLSLEGSFIYGENFIVNGNTFVTRSKKDDVGIRFHFLHNGRDVSKRVKWDNKKLTYKFKDAGMSYLIKFGREGKWVWDFK